MSADTMEERFFDIAFDLAQQAQELGYEFPLVIVFSDQTNRLACILTIHDFGKLLPGDELEWDCSGWIWEWEDRLTRIYDEPFRAALASHDGRTRTAAVPLLSLSEAVEIMRRNQTLN
ncbi:MAG: hypothetical protein DMG32_24895 [Acidobacteria bacterium]|nr:MAG: hypothetical protein DMG32_24895 [Acidobacteriota bacterium]